MPTQIPLGQAVITLLQDNYTIEEGETVSGEPSTGRGPLFEVIAALGTHVRLVDVTWATGERDVRAIEANGPKAVRRLDTGSLRLSVYTTPTETAWIELSQARIKAGRQDLRSNLVKASASELDQGAGLEVFPILESLGGQPPEKKAQLLGVKDGRADYYCVVFDPSNRLLPAAAFVLTRVLPLINGYVGT